MTQPTRRSASPAPTEPQRGQAGDAFNAGSVPEDTGVRIIARRESLGRSLAPERGIYGSRCGFALPVTLDENGYRVPAVADCSDRLQPLVDSLELVHRSGGFQGRLLRSVRCEARFVLRGLHPDSAIARAIDANKTAWLGAARDSLPRAERPRGHAALELAATEAGHLEARLYVEELEPTSHSDGREARMLQRLALALAPRWRELTGSDAEPETQEVVREHVQVRCAIQAREFTDRIPGRDGVRLGAALERGVRLFDLALGAADAARIQNQSVLGAISRVALALGHDPRFVVSDGHAHAARFGGCTPLVGFERRGAFIVGSLELPLYLEPHGRQQAPEAAAALNLTEAHGAGDLRLLAGCVGLASQLPAIEAAIGEAMQHVSTSRKR